MYRMEATAVTKMIARWCGGEVEKELAQKRASEVSEMQVNTQSMWKQV